MADRKRKWNGKQNVFRKDAAFPESVELKYFDNQFNGGVGEDFYSEGKMLSAGDDNIMTCCCVGNGTGPARRTGARIAVRSLQVRFTVYRESSIIAASSYLAAGFSSFTGRCLVILDKQWNYDGTSGSVPTWEDIFEYTYPSTADPVDSCPNVRNRSRFEILRDGEVHVKSGKICTFVDGGGNVQVITGDDEERLSWYIVFEDPILLDFDDSQPTVGRALKGNNILLFFASNWYSDPLNVCTVSAATRIRFTDL